MNFVPASTTPTERCAASSPAISMGDRIADAGIEYDWNAPAGTGSTALGTREPARPGSETRARAVLITDPTTNHLGRTIGRERYDAGPPYAKARRRVVRRTSASADDDELVARAALHDAHAVLGPGRDLDPA